MAEQIIVKTLCGVDVLEGEVVVLTAWTNYPVRDEVLAPEALGVRSEPGTGLNIALNLQQAYGVWLHLGKAIQELKRRQEVPHA